MKLRTKSPQTLVLDEGAVLDGYLVVEHDDTSLGSEMRYVVSGRDGERARLLMSRRPFADRHERARFRRLAELRTGLAHPAAIEVRDFGEHAGHPYLVTEPHSERTLGDLLEDDVLLEPGRLVRMLGPVADALDTAHARGLVHHGLGSDTLVLAGDGSLLLDSFALFELGEEATWSIGERADPRYPPPEQVRGERVASSGNVYSLAAVIVHALTGEPPFPGDRLAQTYAHLAEPPPRLSTRVPRLGVPIDDVIARGLAKDPSQRPGSATELVAEVAEALGTETMPIAPATPAVTTPPRAMPVRRRRASARTAIAAAAAAALCGAALAVAVDPFGSEGQATPVRVVGAGAWERLDAERSDLRTRLAAAEAPQEQAELATRLAAAYGDAARALPPGPEAREARAAGDAYARLAGAAQAGSEAEFAAAASAVAAAEQRLLARG
jgi:serine/threonine-protein kinase